jgi:hypothetical protein
MTTLRKIAGALTTVVALVCAGPAFASNHRIDAHSTRVIEFYACGDFFFSARGDGDTDLDFRLYNPRGRLVHSDYDTTDITFGDIDAGCGTFRLHIENLGRVYNRMELTVI